MDSFTTICIVACIAVIVIVTIICLVGDYLSKKRLDDIVAELGLVRGVQYNITTNNGNRQLNLTYDHISYGKNSQNGRINIYFIKNTKYRGVVSQKEVMIKYGNVCKIETADNNEIYISKSIQPISEKDYMTNTISELNKENEHGNKIGQIQVYVRENYKNMSAKDIYDKAVEMFEYERPTPYSVVHLHYGLNELINLIYKLRETDDTAIDYCLQMCDMDIKLYEDVRNACMQKNNDERVYAGSLSRKIIIFEKQQNYEKALEMCDFAIQNDYLFCSGDFISQKNRIQNKLAKVQSKAKDTIADPINK